MLVGDLLFTVHAIDVVGNFFHGPGPKKRHHVDDIRQVVRFHLHDVSGHAAAFQLEQAGGAPLADKLECLRVIQGNIVQVELDLVALFDQVTGFVDDREGGKA